LDLADYNHNKLIIEQFTKQAIPFAKKSAQYVDETFEKILSVVEVDRKDIVLDVACGTGSISIEFARLCGHVTGIDITPAMIKQAKLLQKENMLSNLKWDTGNVSKQLPYRSNSFSIVVTRFSFHHLLKPLSVLIEMKRVCTVGGQIVVIDPTPPVDKAEMYNYVEKLRDPSHAKALTIYEFENLFEKARIPLRRRGSYTMKIELEDQLRTSFPDPENIIKIRQLFIEDTKSDVLGLNSHYGGDKIFFSYPNSIFVGIKE
jgi:ubiquinone/menaquinone biosynthesis C-methylase UbiE